MSGSMKRFTYRRGTGKWFPAIVRSECIYGHDQYLQYTIARLRDPLHQESHIRAIGEEDEGEKL